MTFDVSHPEILEIVRHALAEDVAAFQSDYPEVTIEVGALSAVPASGRTWHLALGDAGLMDALQSQDRLRPLDDLLPSDLLDNLAAPGRTAS